MHRLSALILFCILFMLTSCEDEDGFYAPVIVFSEPLADDVIKLPDTIDVKVQISSDHTIISVMLTLVNLDKIPVIGGTYFFPDSTDFYLETSLPLVDKNLESGPYKLLVTVSDGSNQKNMYRQIIIHEVPVQLKEYIAVTGQISFQSTIARLNPAFETDTQFVISDGYWLAAVHSRWEKFFFVTREPSTLIALDPESFEQEWEMAAEPPRPLFTGLMCDKELVFSTANGDAGVLSSGGIVILRTAPRQDKTIQCLAADDQYIYASSVSLSGDIRELTIIYRVSGSVRDEKLISGEIRSLIPAAGNVLVFLQIPSGTRILEYVPNDLIITELKLIQDETLQSAVKISEEQLLLLTENRVISYNLSLNQLNVFKDQSYHFCRYDNLSDIVFLVRYNMIYGFDRISGDLKVEKSFPEEVLDFQIVYNK